MKLPLPKDAPRIVDELGDIERKLKPLEDLKRRRDELRAKVLQMVAKLPADKSTVLDGVRYVVHISAKREVQEFRSMAAVQKAVGEKEFLARCSFTLKAAKELLDEEHLAKLVKKENSGPRTLVPVPRMEVAKRKAA